MLWFEDYLMSHCQISEGASLEERNLVVFSQLDLGVDLCEQQPSKVKKSKSRKEGKREGKRSSWNWKNRRHVDVIRIPLNNYRPPSLTPLNAMVKLEINQ
jgi:hypothetical protein